MNQKLRKTRYDIPLNLNVFNEYFIELSYIFHSFPASTWPMVMCAIADRVDITLKVDICWMALA